MKQTTNLIVLGDSNSKGIINENSKLIISSTNAISLVASKFKFSLTNLSYYGQTLAKFCNKGFIRKVIDNKKPEMRNLVVINLGSNDADYNWTDVGLNKNSSHGPRTLPADFKQYYTDLVNELRENGFEVMACSLLPIVSKQYFDNILNYMSDKKILMKLLDGDKNNLMVRQEIFNDIILDVSQKMSVPVLDLRNMMLRQPRWQKLYCYDGIHLTEKGQKFMAKEVIKAYI